jgi:hypothetical protein
MMYDEKQDATGGRKYEHDLGRDPVIQRWLGEVATRDARPETTVIFIDPFPYDEIRFWQCDRCGCQVPTTVLWGIKICGYCGGQGRERSWVKPELRKKLLEQRVEEFLD